LGIVHLFEQNSSQPAPEQLIAFPGYDLDGGAELFSQYFFWASTSRLTAAATARSMGLPALGMRISAVAAS
jgi:hypothetical protein